MTKRRQSLGVKLWIEGFACRLGRKGGTTGPLDMIGLRMGSIPEHHHRISDVFVHGAALGEKCLREHEKWRDVCRIRLPGSAVSAIPVKFATSVNRIVTSCLIPPSSVEIDLSMIPLTISFGTKRAKDQIVRWAIAMVLPSSWISLIWDVTGTPSGSASVRIARLSGYPLQRFRHPAAEDPDHGYEAAAGEQRKHYAFELELPDFLREIVFRRKQQQVSVILPAEGKFIQPRKSNDVRVVGTCCLR